MKLISSGSSSGLASSRAVMLFRLLLRLKCLPPHSSDCGLGGSTAFVASMHDGRQCGFEIRRLACSHRSVTICLTNPPLGKCLCVYEFRANIGLHTTQMYDIIPNILYCLPPCVLNYILNTSGNFSSAVMDTFCNIFGCERVHCMSAVPIFWGGFL